jgi:NDP-sugar pyrophosphorylase family protein
MKNKHKKALILAGGLGTRLRPLTFAIPKPLIPVREKPIIEHIILLLKKHGFDEIFISVGYRSELVRLYCGNGEAFGVKIKYFEEKKPLGTAGPLALFKELGLKADEPILVINGDILTKIDLTKFYKFHRAEKNDLTVALIDYQHQLSYGVVEKDERNKITGIVEKPIFSYQVSGGIYLVGASALPLIPRNSYFTMPELTRKMLKAGLNVGGYSVKEFWLAIEQLKDIEDANRR